MAGEGKLYEVTLTGGLNGSFVQNILHAQLTTSSDADPFIFAVAMALAVIGDWVPTYLDCLPEGYTFSTCRVRGLGADASATANGYISGGGSIGTRAGTCSTYVEGPLLTFPVTFTRPVLGKIFLPGITEDDVDYGVIESGLRTALGTFMTNIIADNSVTGTVTGTYNYCVTNAAKDDWKIPVAGTISPTIGTQRRRAKPAF